MGKGVKRGVSHLLSQINVRRAVQTASFFLFLYLFLSTVHPLRSPIPVDLFLRMSLLVAISAMLGAKDYIARTAVWALIVLIISFFLGRAFCGWVCPMGAILDILDKPFGRWRGRKFLLDRRFGALKFYILAMVLASSLFGTQLAYLFDPISMVTRVFTWSFLAPVQFVLKWIYNSSFVEDHMGFVQVILGKAVMWAFPEGQLFYRMNVLAFLIFLTIVGANALAPRFWCRNLCPLGALLGLISRFPLIRIAVNERCRDCKRCVLSCKTAAIDYNTIRPSSTECVVCLACVDVCPYDAISLKAFPKRIVPEGHEGREPGPAYSPSRRRILEFTGIGIAWALLTRTGAGAKRSVRGGKVVSEFLIRPPGSRAEEEFLARCIRCGECMRVCPTGGLQPALSEAGMEGFWTPVLIPRIGECVPGCNACGDVCPTQAIERFVPDEKYWLYMGTASIDRSRCIAWAYGKRCVVCEEVCTYKAAYTKVEGGRLVPFVDEGVCVGCGLCERYCPVQPVAAIRVFSWDDKRGWTREQRKEWYEERAKERDRRLGLRG
jgi:ferredoxin